LVVKTSVSIEWDCEVPSRGERVHVDLSYKDGVVDYIFFLVKMGEDIATDVKVSIDVVEDEALTGLINELLDVVQARLGEAESCLEERRVTVRRE